MRLIRGLITVVGIIGVLVIIALVMSYYLFSLTPPIKAKMHEVPPSVEAFQSLDQKLEALETGIEAAVDAGEEREISLTITEKEVNSKLAEILAEGELPLEEILINFGEGYFLVYAKVDVPGVDAKTGAKGQIQSVNGDPKVALEDLNLGKLPLPQAVSSGVEELLNIMLRLRLADLPLETTDVEISNRQLTIAGLIKITN